MDIKPEDTNPVTRTVVDSSSKPALYKTADEATKAVRDDFHYWTGKLTDNSLQLSLSVIAANWAAFGSVDKLLSNVPAKLSLILVLLGLAANLVGAKRMGELHRKRMDYAASDLARWESEFSQTLGKRDPWPFTAEIESLGQWLRWIKVLVPLAAGFLFLVALFA